jgi:hypothetical protein
MHLQLGVAQQVRRFKVGSNAMIEQITALQDHMDSLAHSHRRGTQAVQTSNHRIQVAKGKKRRKPRQIAAGLLFLFGIFTAYHYASTNEKVNELQTRSRAIGHVFNDQLSFLNHTYAQQHRLQRQLKSSVEGSAILAGDFAAFQAQVLQEDARISSRFTFLAQSMRTTAIFEQFYDILKGDVHLLREAFFAASKGELHPFFLPLDTYLELASQIQANLPLGKDMVTHDATSGNLHTYYRLAKLTAFQYEGNLRLFLEFPLVARDRIYDVYEPVPLPSSIPSSDLFFSINPEAELMARSRGNEFFFYMTKAELASCHQNLVTICQFAKSVQRTTTQACLPAMWSGDIPVAEKHCRVITQKDFTPVFYKPDNSFSYMYSVPRRINIQLRCERQFKPDFPQYLEGVGYLNLPPTCIAYADTFALLGNGIMNAGNIHLASSITLPDIDQLPSVLSLGKMNLTMDKNKYEKIHALFSQSSVDDGSRDAFVPLSTILAEARAVDEMELTPFGPGNTTLVVMFSSTVICLVLLMICFMRVYYRRCSKKWRPSSQVYPDAATAAYSAAAASCAVYPNGPPQKKASRRR